MNICMVTPFYPPHIGGTQVVVQSLARELTNRGHRVTVVTSASIDGDRQKEERIRVTRLTFPRAWGTTHLTEAVLCVREIVEEHKSEPFDYLHLFHVFPFGITAVLLKKVLHLPLMTTLMGLETYSLHGRLYGPGLAARFSGPLRPLVLTVSDVVTAPSVALAGYMHAQGCKKQIEVIPHGVNLEEYNSTSLRVGARDLRENLGIGPDEQMILTVHRLHQVKDFTTAIRALRRVLKERPNTRLVVVGEGPQFERLRVAAENEHVASSITCVGSVNHDELPIYYAAADLFLLSTFYETFGLVLVEAMAASRCVVASNTGAVREIVQDGITGFLFPVGNVDTLATILLRTLADDKLRSEIGHRARRRVVDHYSLAKTAQRYLDRYTASR